MTYIDYVVAGIYLLLVTAVGALRISRHIKPVEFHLAGRSMGSMMIGVSTMATVFSALNFVAFSTEIYSNGLYVLMVIPAFALVSIAIMIYVIPLYHRLGLTTVYQLLEESFDRRVRSLAAAMFIIWRVTWAGLVLYALCMITGKITGINLYILIVTLGAITTAYTAAGGMRAVMRTDFFQTILLFAALGTVAYTASESFRTCGPDYISIVETNVLKPFFHPDWSVFSFDPTIRMTFWSCIIGGFVAFLSRYGTDQMVVQRYLTASSLKSAKQGFGLNILLHIIALLLLGAFAVSLKQWSLITQGPATGQEALAGFFISLPPGVTGIVVTALLASTMSSVDSAIHSSTTIMAYDIKHSSTSIQKPASNSDDRRITIVLGLVVSLTACFVGNLGTIFEIANKIINALGAPLLAMFISSLKNNWSGIMNKNGVFWGGIIGFICASAASLYINTLSIHYYSLVNLLVTLLLCYLISKITSKNNFVAYTK